MMPEVSVIIPNWNRKDVLRRTLEHLAPLAGEAELETIVVDNASSDGAPEMVERDFRSVKLLRLDENIGAAARNVGLEHARGRYVVMLDNDSYPAAGAIALAFATASTALAFRSGSIGRLMFGPNVSPTPQKQIAHAGSRRAASRKARSASS